MPLSARGVEIVDEMFAATFGIDVDDVWAPGVSVVSHVAPRLVDWDGIVLFARDARMLVSAPPADGPAIAAFLREHDEVLSSPADVDALARALAGGRQVLGPSWWGFADELLPVDAGDAVTRVVDDIAALDALRDAVGEDEWSESGFDRNPTRLVAVQQGSVVVAAANLTAWRTDADDVGVCVHPSHRGSGLGRVAAGAAMAIAITGSGVCRYRALTTNGASLRIAQQLGVVGAGVQHAILRASAEVVEGVVDGLPVGLSKPCPMSAT